MNQSNPRRSKHGGESAKPAEKLGALPGQSLNVDLAADARRQRMAEYCRRAAAPYHVPEAAPSLVHHGEFYLPGVF